MSDGYTIVSAQWGNEEKTSAVMQTKESGAVAVSERDRPVLWAKLMASGIPIAPMRVVVHRVAPTIVKATDGGPDVLA